MTDRESPFVQSPVVGENQISSATKYVHSTQGLAIARKPLRDIQATILISTFLYTLRASGYTGVQRILGEGPHYMRKRCRCIDPYVSQVVSGWPSFPLGLRPGLSVN
ncbi:Hypothetical protein NTJ_12496 [Nesidiocoris tenuis]|uniref:Uncharacterized protein n=1 Tax=Nesidiocoris tenuis TaxID=355587 RepID=A0ABN7B755_9HEMI|nr:Hypothetical protein NTJ_12496 [Nesidiocoris tenuis]